MDKEAYDVVFTVCKAGYSLRYEDGFLTILNAEGRKLQRFPFAARLTLADGAVLEASGDARLIDGRVERAFENLPEGWSEAVLSADLGEDELVFSFRARCERDISIGTMEYLREGKCALSMNDNLFNFSPAPRNAMGYGSTLYKRPCDCSCDGYFTPPPFLFVMGNPAGKTAFSLLDMPNSYRFCLSDKFGVLAECPGGNLTIPAGESYCAPRLMLTFPTDEWDALATYYRKLVEKGAIAPIPAEEKDTPDWWRTFAVCTYGDQMAQLQYNMYTSDDWASPSYNTAWLRRWLNRAEKRLGRTDFTVIIDAFWQYEWSLDPYPDRDRFPDLREFIDECHARGHHVLLWIVPFCSDARGKLAAIEQGGRETGAQAGDYAGETLAGRHHVVTRSVDGTPHVDWTSDGIEGYLAELCGALFGAGAGCLDADGVKIDGVMVISDPMNTRYAHPERGIGVKELMRFYKLFTEAANKVKPGALINTSTANPFFENVAHINRLGDQSVYWEREARARISSLIAPNMPMDSDGVFYSEWTKKAYLAATVYAVPYLYTVDALLDGPAHDDETMLALGRLFSLAARKPRGRAVYVSEGCWQWETRGRVTAACFDSETVVVFAEGGAGYVFSWRDGEHTIPLFGHVCPDDPGANRLRVRLAAGSIFRFDYRD